ncbi:hypothetical protein SBADM41S_01577 [Streptomyces badius]
MRAASVASPCGVAVPWALTWSTSSARQPASRSAASTAARATSPEGCGLVGWWASVVAPVPGEQGARPAAPGPCPLLAFQDEHGGALADDEARPGRRRTGGRRRPVRRCGWTARPSARSAVTTRGVSTDSAPPATTTSQLPPSSRSRATATARGTRRRRRWRWRGSGRPPSERWRPRPPPRWGSSSGTRSGETRVGARGAPAWPRCSTRTETPPTPDAEHHADPGAVPPGRVEAGVGDGLPGGHECQLHEPGHPPHRPAADRRVQVDAVDRTGEVDRQAREFLDPPGGGTARSTAPPRSCARPPLRVSPGRRPSPPRRCRPASVP